MNETRYVIRKHLLIYIQRKRADTLSVFYKKVLPTIQRFLIFTAASSLESGLEGGSLSFKISMTPFNPKKILARRVFIIIT